MMPHVYRVNKLTEIQYLRKVADVMLRALMPPDITASDPTRTVVSLHVWFMHVITALVQANTKGCIYRHHW